VPAGRRLTPTWRQVFGRGMANSVDALLCLLLLVAIACVLFGALIFECAHPAGPRWHLSNRPTPPGPPPPRNLIQRARVSQMAFAPPGRGAR
jgi:hypothetical protein